MTSKEKAIELVGRFYDYVNCWGNDGNADYSLAKENARQCALIAVDEIIKSSPLEPSNPYSYYICEQEAMKFWQEVKQEIEKL